MSQEDSTVQTMPSNRDQLALLDVFETLTRSTLVPTENIRQLNEIKLAYRRTWSAAIGRAKALTGYEYTMETVETITSSGNIFVVMIITRTA